MEVRPVSAVIPALNEELHIGEIVSELTKSKHITQIVVAIDGRTTDDTARIAELSGATVLKDVGTGLGRVFKAGIEFARNDLIFRIDGDLPYTDHLWVDRMVEAMGESRPLIKSFWDYTHKPRLSTLLVARPLIEKLCPELSYIHMPISGIYLFDKSLVKTCHLADDMGIDIQILLQAHYSNGNVGQIEIPPIFDRQRTPFEVVPVATDVMNGILNYFASIKRQTPMIVLMAHPDDLEIWLGGTFVKLADAGHPITVIILTKQNGGFPVSKALEKEFKSVSVMSLNSTELRRDPHQEQAKEVSKVLARNSKATFITHSETDVHPDHRRCFTIATESLFHTAPEHRPGKFYTCSTYMLRDWMGNAVTANHFVDISEVADRKYELVDRYKTDSISYYIDMIKNIDRLNGMLCGVAYAEGFTRHHLYRASSPEAAL